MQPLSFFQHANLDPQVFDLNEYNKNGAKDLVLEVDFEYRKELQELQNNYPLAPDKIKINKEMMSKYQLMISDFRKLMPHDFDKEKYVVHSENLQIYLRLGLKLKNTLSIRIQSTPIVKTMY